MKQRNAFTLIELIVAISVIAILAGMLIVGIQYVGASSREKATRVTLENLQSMLTELENTAGLGRLPAFRSISAPGYIGEGSAIRMNDAFRYTRDAMAILQSVPANASSIAQLPPETMAVLPWQGGVSYLTDDQVTHDGVVYHATDATTAEPPGGTWTPSARAVPLPIDAWGNPIIFVAPPITHANWSTDGIEVRYGLTGVTIKGESGTYRVVNPGGIDYPAGSKYPADEDNAALSRLQHFRPFWVSAGPDGNFQTHDDNIYSFEN